MAAKKLPPNDPRHFELLANHLRPRFGSVTDQSWTDELKEAVVGYLLDELPDDVASYLLGPGAAGAEGSDAKRKAIDALVASYMPWEVANEVREAAVLAVPTLDELIGDLVVWPSDNERWDASAWLDAHATEDMLRGMAAELADRRGERPSRFSELYLTAEQSPRELLAAWHGMVGPVASDLTDTEWEMILPLLPTRGPSLTRTEEGRARLRRRINGMLYRYHERVGWSEVPRRYGEYSELNNQYNSYKHLSAVFRSLLAGLEDAPGAERLVAWLRDAEAS